MGVACAWMSAMEATATLLLCALCAVGKNFIVVNLTIPAALTP